MLHTLVANAKEFRRAANVNAPRKYAKADPPAVMVSAMRVRRYASRLGS
jgi:hypothetical protein